MFSILVLLAAIGLPGWQSDAAAPERTSFLASVHIAAGEESGAVVCILCSVRVEGKVFEEVVTVGGNIVVVGSVEGEAVAAGGDITLLPGGKVADEVVAVGGRVYRDPTAESGEITEIPYFHLAGQRAFHWQGLLLFAVAALALGSLGFLLLGPQRINRMGASWRTQPWILITLGVGSFAALTFAYVKADWTGSWEDFITRILQGVFLACCWIGFVTLSQVLGAPFGRVAAFLRFALGCAAAVVLLWLPVVGFFLFFLLFPLGFASALGSGMGQADDWLKKRLVKTTA